MAAHARNEVGRLSRADRVDRRVTESRERTMKRQRLVSLPPHQINHYPDPRVLTQQMRNHWF